MGVVATDDQMQNWGRQQNRTSAGEHAGTAETDRHGADELPYGA